MSKMFFLSTTFNKGGASHCAIEIYNELKDRNEILLVNLFPDSNFASSEVSDAVITLSSTIHGSKVRRASIYLIILLRYVRLLYSKYPHVSMSINSLSHIFNILACKITSVKPVIAVHDLPTYFSTMDIFGKIMKEMPMYMCKYLGIKNIITVSQGLKDLLVDTYNIEPSNISVIYNPLDITKITQLSCDEIKEALFHVDIPIIITVGNVIPVKGHWHLLRIFERIRGIIPCKLVICGHIDLDTQYYEYLQTIVKAMKYKEDVYFTGWVSNPYKYMAKSTVFVLSSLSEGFSYVIIESMICGCPIVSADCNVGPRELLENGKYGFLSKPLDEVYYSLKDSLTEAEIDMMEKIMLMLTDNQRRSNFIEIAKLRATEFDKEVIFKKYTDYFSCINR